MNKTVVAIFNSADEAQDAADQLSAKGFSRDHIDLFSGKNSTHEEDHGESGISRFFKNLFGSGDDKQERYAKVAKRGYMKKRKRLLNCWIIMGQLMWMKIMTAIFLIGIRIMTRHKQLMT